MRPDPVLAAHRSVTSGKSLLATGLAVGAIGAAGALLGAVCPLCVIATPTLLGLGVVQTLRGRWLAARAAAVPPLDSARTEP